MPRFIMHQGVGPARRVMQPAAAHPARQRLGPATTAPPSASPHNLLFPMCAQTWQNPKLRPVQPPACSATRCLLMLSYKL
mmetsp:Transcript_3213/g.7030  ORF Transcript_3213/g.7030 Transcript_3213/m.7030 type:complete len:80 (-) Transcript_3213:1152-1391(-)